MRPGVVPDQRDTTPCTALNGKKQAVIAGRTAGIHLRDRSEILSDRRIRQTQPAALLRVGDCRACVVVHSLQGARFRSEKYGRIEIAHAPKMSRMVSEIRCRYEPISLNLPLDAEVPLGDMQVWDSIIRGEEGAGKRPYCVVAADTSSGWHREWIAAGFVCPWVIKTHAVPNDLD